MADASTCALALLVDAHLAKAIIGTGGSAVRKLKIESGVHSIHLSTFIPGGTRSDMRQLPVLPAGDHEDGLR